LVFLRHFGCVFCRETVSDLREAAEADESFPDVIFFAEASPVESRVFLRRYWPGARAISDLDEVFYDGFGIERASKFMILSPQMFAAKRRATAKGHEMGPRSGDIWRMPAAFVVEGDRILWGYEPKHPGDHPDFDSIPALLSASASRA
jgi:hypothetical protein